MAAPVPDPHATDLSAFHGYVDFESWENGNFTKVRGLADAIHGKVIRYKWRNPHQDADIDVVGKKMKSENVRLNEGRLTNEKEAHAIPLSDPRSPHPEDALTEIGVLSYLRQQPHVPIYLLRMLGAFRDDTHTFLVTEFVSDGELFNHVANGRMGADEGVVRGLMWQLLQGTRFLHAHEIGHRDISLENVLISFDRDQHHLRLMDFGQAVRTRSSCGQVYLRYFRPAGKPYYRGPECYVPGDRPQVLVCCPPHAHGLDVVFVDNLNRNGTPNGYRNEVRLPPHATPGQTCLAEFWGYEVPPLDVFALGVCFFILAWRVPPWGRALPLDANFTYIQQHGIPPLLNAWQKRHLSPEAMNLLTEMVSADPRRRPSVQACLESAWLVPLKDDPVPTQPAAAMERGDASSTVPADDIDMESEMARMNLGAPQA